MKPTYRNIAAGLLLAGTAGVLLAEARSRRSSARRPVETGEQPRIVILGGGFGGVYTARHLEKLLAPGEAEVVLISRHNYFLMTPLLFEVGAGVLDVRDIANPIRSMLRTARFVEGSV